MSDQKDTKKQARSKLGLTAEEAAGASIAQSISLAAQNEVDAFRNQNTVNMVAMGVAYAKWLQNPVMGEQFRELVKTTRLSSDSEQQVVNKAFGGRPSSTSSSASNPLPTQVFSHFLSPPNSAK
ncbi:hypothetical protein ORJ04_03505 [Rheinheimera baltica]|uniref:Uncharacterized protein n=1 Tax=Rheinheimera baltica TaxID=67576 RepID=A0ABT9HV73_9GAMM|nr:hypothetical protein [Rheinheimera baltica]MDP5135013.1 hypothetical protein [Rheinheimera baltica]